MRHPTLLSLILTAALSAPGPSDPQRAIPAPRTVTVQLLAINDLHGHLEPPTGSNGRINAIAAGGAEYLATHVKNDIARNPNSIVVAAGDLVGASPLVSSMFHDEPAIEAMNAMGLAVTSVGNHEFDEGVGEALRLKRGGCHPKDGCQDGDGFDGARFAYLSANVVRKATRTVLFPATAVRTVGGVRIGFIGETFKGTSRIVPSEVNKAVTFLDEAATANAHAALLKRQGVRAIVLLIHEGGRQHPAEGDATPDGCADFSGPIEGIVKRLTPDIAVVVSGHSHAFYNCRIGGHLVTSAGSFGRLITRITLDIDRSTGRVVHASATNEIVTRDVPTDPEQTRIIAKYAALVEDLANTVVGSVTADLVAVSNAAGESPLGDVVADAQLAASNAAGRGGAVVAFMNPGGIRANIDVGTERTTRRGEVTYKDLFNVQPFGNVVTVVTMTGDMIKRLLEQQFDSPAPGARKILQVSAGFTYRYRLAAPAGQHIDADSIQINGRRVAPTDRVRVAASDFLLGGGDGFTVFGEGTNTTAVMPDIDALVEYFKADAPVEPPPQTRIVRTDSGP